MANRVLTTGRALLILAALTGLWGGCSEHRVSQSPPTLEVTPDRVDRVVLFEHNTAGQWIQVRNVGDGVATYSASVGGGSTWVALFGEVDDTAPDSFFVNFFVGGVQAGVYHETVWVASPEAVNAPVAVPLTLTVTNSIVVEPTRLLFLTVSGESNPPAQPLIIRGASTSSFEYTLSEGASWMALSKYAGIAEDTVAVSADMQLLDPGMYVDSISITSPIGETPVSVACTLIVASWINDSLQPSFSLRGVQCIDPSTLIVSGLISGGAEIDGILLQSQDDGVSWDVSIRDEGLGDIHFSDAVHGWVVGRRGTVLRTVDGGDSWITDSLMDLSIDLNAVFFADSLHGWTAGSSGKLYRTVNGGNDWMPAATGTTDELRSVVMVDALRGWAVGNRGTILSSSDSGKTWQDYNWSTVNDFSEVVFADASHGWIFGELGTILYTSTGGTDWSVQQSPTTANLHAAAFAGPNRGWAVGDNGAIIFTDDGEHWSIQPSGVSVSLFDVVFRDENEGWICGESGTLLHTTGGGL